MALIEFSGVVARVRGRVGNSIFQSSPYGNIFRGFCAPVNKDTPEQNLTRAITSRLQHEWLKLTPAQRTTWDKFRQYAMQHTRKSVHHFINGQASFIKANHIRLQYDLPILATPTFTRCDVSPVFLSLSLVAGDLTATLDRPADSTQEFVVLFVSYKVPPSWNNPRSSRKLLKFTTTSAASFNINAEYLARFGLQLVPGDTIFYKWTNADKRSGLFFPYKSGRVTL